MYIFRMYLTLHSYSQMWLIPWGHTHSKPLDYSNLINIAKKAVNAITKVHGTHYQIGTMTDLMYPTSGIDFNIIYFNFNITDLLVQ